MRESRLLTFSTHDALELSYRHWPALSPTGPTRRAVVMFHRGHEHSGRLAHLVDELDLPDCDFFAWDARGHGLSPGPRGDSPSFATSVRDVQTFIDHIGSMHCIKEEDLAIVAQSVGAVVIATWAHDYAQSSGAGAGVTGVQGKAVCTIRTDRPKANTSVSRQLLRRQLRQGPLPDARSRADPELSAGSAHHQGHFRQYAPWAE